MPDDNPVATQATDATDKTITVTPELLRGWPLPEPDESGDKNARGRVLIVGGAPTMPGTVILAGTAALRAGAGKVQIATCASVAQSVAVAIPESYVVGLPETKGGGIDPSAARTIADLARMADAVLVGPGLSDRDSVQQLLKSLLPLLTDTEATVVLDAEALMCVKEDATALHELAGRALLTPHAGELADMRGIDKSAVQDDPLAAARAAAVELRATVALKGAETYIVSPEPDAPAYHVHSNNVGLATSGSGDTLAGVVAGLAARGVEPARAAAWGVYLRASAGDRLAKRIGRVGFLARELLAEIPVAMHEVASRQ